MNVYLMRGLPGSGKSTVVNELRTQFPKLKVFSTDNKFMVEGEYRFAPSQLRQYHEETFAAFAEAAAAGETPLLVDNTNIVLEHLMRYVRTAVQHGYQVTVVELQESDVEKLAARNVHGVPAYAISRMLHQFEDLPPAFKLIRASETAHIYYYNRET